MCLGCTLTNYIWSKINYLLRSNKKHIISFKAKGAFWRKCRKHVRFKNKKRDCEMLSSGQQELNACTWIRISKSTRHWWRKKSGGLTPYCWIICYWLVQVELESVVFQLVIPARLPWVILNQWLHRWLQLSCIGHKPTQKSWILERDLQGGGEGVGERVGKGCNQNALWPCTRLLKTNSSHPSPPLSLPPPPPHRHSLLTLKLRL